MVGIKDTKDLERDRQQPTFKMAEERVSKPNTPPLVSAVRRASTDPGVMDGERLSSQDGEAAPRSRGVRFSQDVDRAASTSASPDLSTVTQMSGGGGGSSAEGQVPGSSGILARKGTTLNSPRTRDRGYSLRRSLFARTINNQSSEQGSPIELAEAGPSSAAGQIGVVQEEGQQTKKGTPTVVVSPVFQQDDLSEPASGGPPAVEKKTFGTINLPNYDVWARQTVKSNHLLQTLKEWKKTAKKILLRQTPLPPSKDGRHIELDAARTTPLIDERTGQPYVGNAIRSSRYTLWNFVPRQLFFQFSKLANAYFLLVSILQMIPGLSTTGSYTTIAPLLVFVCISMGKVSKI